MRKFLLLFFSTLSSVAVYAQEEVGMADTMRSEGKIYVVVAILGLILFGLFGYLVVLDRKVTKLEKKLPEKK
ncbi:MAG TPA: CcmD family protein [Cyclobacteriaceae bacterium]|nr:CcmD family protein [Cyclobacteriaceae bacterium]MCB9238026.1 CcmD family protein [Flammeovirgaceae bacterium]MCB0499134.1 CcmD family protein [Cyclobacteriaceae bacterium]MCO5272934.1 CcmD family protein [Cyclobacteriaceae bacterium]MCW5901650.1 CcmD family protein [Cyclobacteriaceae bacterium]